MSLNRVQAVAADTEQSAEYSAERSAQAPGGSGPGAAGTRDVTVRQAGCCCGGGGCLPRAARLTFRPESLERLYQGYFRRQRQDNLPVLALFAALFNGFVVVMCAVAYTEDKLATVAVAAAGLAADAALYALCRLRGLPASPVLRGAAPYALWLMVTVHVLCYMRLNYEPSPRASDAAGWQAFFSFSSFLTLPLDLVPLVLLAALSCGVQTLMLGVTVAQRMEDNLQGPMLVRQVNVAPRSASGMREGGTDGHTTMPQG